MSRYFGSFECRTSECKFKGVLLALLLAVLPVAASAENLSDLIQLAAQHDSKYLSALHNNLAVAENPTIAWSDYFPKASIQADGSYTDQDIVRVDNPLYAKGRTSYPTESYSVVVQQPLFNWETIKRINQADAEVGQALAQLEEARQDLIVRVSEAYFTLLTARNALALTQAEKTVVAKHLEQANEQKIRGFAGRPDVADAQARLALVEAKEIDAKSQIQDSIQALVELTNAKPASILDLDAEATFQSPDPDDISVWVQRSLERNPTMRSKQRAVEVARQEIKRRSAAYYPTLNLTAKYGRQDAGGGSYGGGGAVVDTGQVLMNLNIPIYQGPKVSAQVRQADELLSAAVAEEAQARRTVERKTRAAFLSIAKAIKRSAALKEAVSAQEIALEAKREGYKQGVFSTLDVLTAEKALTEAKTEYEKARCEYVLNRLRLLQSSGEISENDLQGINASLTKPASLLD